MPNPNKYYSLQVALGELVLNGFTPRLDTTYALPVIMVGGDVVAPALRYEPRSDSRVVPIAKVAAWIQANKPPADPMREFGQAVADVIRNAGDDWGADVLGDIANLASKAGIISN